MIALPFWLIIAPLVWVVVDGVLSKKSSSASTQRLNNAAYRDVGQRPT